MTSSPRELKSHIVFSLLEQNIVLLLRHDNADLRLTEYGHELGLIDEARYAAYKKKWSDIEEAIGIMAKTNVADKKGLNAYFEEMGYPADNEGHKGLELLKRPHFDYRRIAPLMPELSKFDFDDDALLALETRVKYEGYIKKEEKEAATLVKQEGMLLPTGVDYLKVEGLRLEARQKLNAVQPRTIAQASRISGVNPCRCFDSHFDPKEGQEIMTYEELHKLCWDSDIVISVETMAKLRDYAHLLMKWNKKMNLTAIDQEEDIVEKHFYDCIIPAKVFDFHDKTLVDLGTGAGFPGMLLAVLYPTLQVTLIDATAKKFEFLKDVKEQLNLTNVKFVVGRVEEQSALRETFDVCTARGFGSLSEIIEVGVPLLKVGGTLIAMKSSKGVERSLEFQ
jgi:16S rRNA (guanine(527)-N(7))-methyltransferase RsmG